MCPPNGDYKHAIQMIAEEFAGELHDVDFYSLPETLRDTIYEQAIREYVDRVSQQADLANDEKSCSIN